MGAEFSAGPLPRELAEFKTWGLNQVEGRYNKFRNIGESQWFITKAEYKEVMQVEGRLGHKQFMCFDRKHRQRCAAQDIFGALCLISDSEHESKVKFLCGMMDLSFTRKLSQPELVMVMRSCSNGLAGMKKLESPPLHRIERLAYNCFSSPKSQVDKSGNCSIERIVQWSTREPDVIFYLLDLSSAKGADVAALWKSQRDVYKELSEIEIELELIEHEQYLAMDDQAHKGEGKAAPKKDVLIKKRMADQKKLEEELNEEERRRHSRIKARQERATKARRLQKPKPGGVKVARKPIGGAARRAMTTWELEEEELEIALEKMRASYLDMEYAMDVDGVRSHIHYTHIHYTHTLILEYAMDGVSSYAFVSR
jgi:hypothetical protein